MFHSCYYYQKNMKIKGVFYYGVCWSARSFRCFWRHIYTFPGSRTGKKCRTGCHCIDRSWHYCRSKWGIRSRTSFKYRSNTWDWSIQQFFQDRDPYSRSFRQPGRSGSDCHAWENACKPWPAQWKNAWKSGCWRYHIYKRRALRKQSRYDYHKSTYCPCSYCQRHLFQYRPGF